MILLPDADKEASQNEQSRYRYVCICNRQRIIRQNTDKKRVQYCDNDMMLGFFLRKAL